MDGSDNKSTAFNNEPRVQNANWSPEKDTLNIDSRVTFNYGGRKIDIKSKETWTLQRKGKKLVISRVVSSSRGKQASTVVYNKQ